MILLFIVAMLSLLIGCERADTNDANVTAAKPTASQSNEIATLTKRIEGIEARYGVLATRLGELENQYAAMANQLGGLEAQYATLANQLGALATQQATLTKQYGTMNETYIKQLVFAMRYANEVAGIVITDEMDAQFIQVMKILEGNGS